MRHGFDEYLDFAIQKYQNVRRPIPPPLFGRGDPGLEKESEGELLAELPEGYLNFLRRVDGFWWSDLEIFAGTEGSSEATELVEVNLGTRCLEEDFNYLKFASSGISWYVHNIAKARFETLSSGTFDAMEVYQTFDELLSAAFEEDSPFGQ